MESSRFSKFWLKTSAAVGCLSLLAFETVVFIAMPSSTKYKIYRFQFMIVLNLVFYPGSKYFWRRLVQNLVSPKTPALLKYTWKSAVFSFIIMAHFSSMCGYVYMGIEPSYIAMASWTCFGMYIILFTFLVSMGAVGFVLKRLKGRVVFKKKHQSLISAVFTICFTIVAVKTAIMEPIVVNVEIPIENLPKSMDGTKLVLISDIHLGPTVGRSSVERIATMTNQLKPDILVMAGDLTDATVDAMGEAAEPLSQIIAPYGKYFATGNHEYYTGDVENWFKLLESFDFHILHNSNVKIHDKSDDKQWICMAGVDDIQADQIGYTGHGMNLKQAYEGCDEKHSTILVAHQPKAAKFALDSDYKIQLVLSGHTHGGQMYPIIWLAYFLNPYLSGLYQHGASSYVYVSQGSVYYGFPLRLGSYPEITNIILRSV
ncbi:transmembrane protein with metallophosphoesterase domain-like [Ciona intestinalis]